MNHQEDHAFNELLRTWLKHEDLRAQRAPIASLAASRSELDDARLRSFRTTPA